MILKFIIKIVIEKQKPSLKSMGKMMRKGKLGKIKNKIKIKIHCMNFYNILRLPFSLSIIFVVLRLTVL